MAPTEAGSAKPRRFSVASVPGSSSTPVKTRLPVPAPSGPSTLSEGAVSKKLS